MNNQYLKQTKYVLLFSLAIIFISQRPVGNDLKVVADSTSLQQQERDRSLAESYHQKGMLLYDDGKHQEAFNQFDTALSIRRLSLDSFDKDIARNYIMLGLTHYELNHFLRSTISYQKAHNVLLQRQNQGDSVLWATFYSSYGSALNKLGEYQQAQYQIEKGLLNNTSNTLNIANFYDILATSIDALGQPQQAIRYYFQSAKFNLLAHEISNLARNFSNIGNTYRALSKPDSALLATWTAFYYFNQEQEKKTYTYIQIANTHNELAHTYYALNQLDKAQYHYNLARQLIEQYGENTNPWLSESLIGLGQVANKKSNKTQALQYFHQAVSVVIPEFNNTPVLATPSVKEAILQPLKAIDALAARGRFLQELAQEPKAPPQYLTVAQHNFALLDSLIFNVCNSYVEDNSKIRLIETSISIYESAASLSLQSRDTLAFLHYTDRPKALVLRSLMTDRQIKQISDIPKEALTYERDLDIDIAYWHKKSMENQKDTATQTAFFDAKHRLEKWTDSLPIKYPRYAELKKDNKNTPLSIKDIQSRLKDSMALIEYFVGNDSIYTLFVSKTKTLIQSQVVPVGFRDSFNVFRHSFTTDSSGNELKNNFLRLSPLFYKWLIKDPLSIINEKGTINRLRIVPDGILGYLPFNVLMTQTDSTWQYNESHTPPFLGNDYAISYDYSRELMFDSTFYRVLPNTSTTPRFGGFGIQYDDLTLNWMKIEGKQFEKLDKSPREVQNVKAQIGGDVFTDGANKPLLKDFFIQSSRHYSILHLSMHGAINDNDPLSSALIFSKKDTFTDNLLTAADLYALDFNHNDLTVLSACQTASGQLHRGEGIMSLARAFVMGGSKSVLATLWSVGNDDMYQLMPLFYENLKKGMDKDLALQAAQKTYSQTHLTTVPNKWAAPILIGSLEAIPLDTPNYRWWIALAVVVLSILGVIYYRKQKGKP